MPRVLQAQKSPISYDAASSTITVAGNLKSKRPDQVLAALAGVAAQRMENPAWLETSPEMGQYLAQLSPIERRGLPDLMTASVSRTFDASRPTGLLNSVFGRVKKGPSQYFGQLESKTAEAPQWYSDLNRSIRDRVELGVNNLPDEAVDDIAEATIPNAGSAVDEATSLVDNAAPPAAVDPADVAPATSGQIEVVTGYRPRGSRVVEPPLSGSRHRAALNDMELESFERHDLYDPTLF
jgi:hypothetical protein